MTWFIIFIASVLVVFVVTWFCVDFIPEYVTERNRIEYLKIRKEWFANAHPCKYHKDNLVTCHEKEGKENCINCPYIPFEEECKYYNI